MKKALLYILGICLIFSIAEARDDAKNFDREVFYLRMYGLSKCLAHHLEPLYKKLKKETRDETDAWQAKPAQLQYAGYVIQTRDDYAKLLDKQSKKEILRYMNTTSDSAPLDWIKSKETITHYDLCTIIFDTQEYKKEAQRIIQKNCKDCKIESKSLDTNIAEAKDNAKNFDRKTFYLKMYGLAECLLRRTSKKKKESGYVGLYHPDLTGAWFYYAELLDEQSKKEIFRYMINVASDSAPLDWIKSKETITRYDLCTIILDTPEYKKEAQRIIKKNAKIAK